MKLEDEKTRKE